MIDTEGSFISSAEISCPIRKHLESDSSITLQISFNGLEFYQVTESLELSQDVRVFPSVPKFELFSANVSIYSQMLAL